MPLPALLGSLVDYALPPRCPICGTTVDADNRFCLACWRQLDFLAKPWCASCGLPFAFERAEDSRGTKCLSKPPILDGVRAVVRYDGRSSLIAMRLKYGTRLGLAGLIADHLQKFAIEYSDNAIIVPVPLHHTRQDHSPPERHEWSPARKNRPVGIRFFRRCTGTGCRQVGYPCGRRLHQRSHEQCLRTTA